MKSLFESKQAKAAPVVSGFRREKFVPRGGPDGGDGGDGGSIYLIAKQHINTLMDFRHKRLFRAENGGYGMGKLRTGKKGEDLYGACAHRHYRL